MGSRKLTQNLALAAASVVATLFAAEILVRVVLGPWAPLNLTLVPPSIRAPSPHSSIPFLLAPNSETVHDFGSNPRGYFDGDGTLSYRINSVGLRDREVQREKQPGVFRILGIGDSFTFGTGVRLEDLFLTRLQRHFDASESPRPFEVLNLGIMGFNTAQEVALLRHVGLGFEPDLVILFLVLNDAKIRFQPRKPPKSLPSALRPQLFHRLSERIERRRRGREAVRRTRAEFHPSALGWKQVQQAWMDARVLSRAYDFRLAVVVFPYMIELDGEYPYSQLHERLAYSVRALDLPVLDLLPAFRGEDGESLWVHPSNQHPNERAHAIAADAIHTWLRESGLLEAG